MSQYNSYDEKPKNPIEPLYSWSEAWTAALTRPGTATFEELLRDPQSTRERAFKWIFVTGTIGVLASVITFVNLVNTAEAFGDVVRFDNLFITLLCAAILGGPLILLAFIVGHGITQFVARLLGGTGNYGDYYYAVACFAAPLTLINVALSAFTGTLGFDLANLVIVIYQFILTGMALRAINRFSWGKVIRVFVILFFIGMAIGSIITILTIGSL